MKRARWVIPVAAVGIVVVASGGKAAAHLEGGCEGSGIFRESGLDVDARGIGDEVVVVPISDTVDWQGSVAGPPGEYSGSISVDLPPPFGEAQIDSWGGESDSTENAGAKDYDLPSLVPAGVEFRVVGSHTDDNGSCSGYVNLEIDGGPFDSALTPISLVGTVVAGAGLVFTVRPLFKGSPL